MKSKSLFVVMVALLFVFTSVSTGLGQQEKWVVFTVKNIVNPFWKACWVGSQKAVGEVKGIKLTYSSPTKSDNIDEQTRMMEDIILQRPKGIVFVPVDYVALVPTVEKMNKAGIPVFNYCNEMAGENMRFMWDAMMKQWPTRWPNMSSKRSETKGRSFFKMVYQEPLQRRTGRKGSCEPSKRILASSFWRPSLPITID